MLRTRFDSFTELRKRLFDAIADNPSVYTVRADDYLIVDVAKAREQLAARADALQKAGKLISWTKNVVGGKPVFKGTLVPVRTVSLVKAQGATEDKIVDDYPALFARMVELAEIWTAAHPARGRPKNSSEHGLRVKKSKRILLKSGRTSTELLREVLIDECLHPFTAGRNRCMQP